MSPQAAHRRATLAARCARPPANGDRDVGANAEVAAPARPVATTPTRAQARAAPPAPTPKRTTRGGGGGGGRGGGGPLPQITSPKGEKPRWRGPPPPG